MRIELPRSLARLPRPAASPMWGLPPHTVFDWRWFALIIMACAMYVGFALTPSSYAIGLEMLGQPAAGTLFGSPRGIRSDEWMVLTPYIQIAVENHFASTNAASPYGESLRTFQALPLFDWALVFKPYHWGFFIAPPAYGYSFYFFFMAAAFLAGWSLLLRQLGLSAWLAVPVALSLFFSQYIQVWWTTNAGAFSLAPWVALAWMQPGRRLLRIGLTAYAMLAWLLSCAYPPFLYSIALAIGILIIAFRRDTIGLRSFYDATVAGSIALALFIGYFHELIDIMQQTVYPGRRIAASGGLDLERLAAHINPSALIRGFEPLARIPNSNACEIAVLATLLPLYAIVLGDHRKFREWSAAHGPAVFVILAGLALFASWMFLSVNPVLARVSGLYLVPPSRALVGFGLLVNVAGAAYVAIAGLKAGPLRAGALVMVIVAASAAKYVWSGASFAETFSLFDAVPLVMTALLLVSLLLTRAAAHRAVLVCWAAAAANMAMFGTFNPVQSAHPIFNLDRDAVRASLVERGATVDKDGTFVAKGHYGALIPGAGIPSVNHVLYTPKLEFFRRYFPDLEEGRFNEIFNRYAHVSVNDASEPTLVAPDSLSVPWDVMTGTRGARPEMPHAREVKRLEERPHVPDGVGNGHVDEITLTADGRLRIVGWLRTPPGPHASVGIWSDHPLADVTLTSIARPDVAASVSGELAFSGFVMDASLTPDEAATEICIAAMRDDTVDTTVQFPDGTRTCYSVTAEMD